MCMKKKFAVLLLIMNFVLNMAIYPLAAPKDEKLSKINNNSIYLDAESKLSFAEHMDKKCQEALTKGEIYVITDVEKNELLTNFSFSTGQERENMRLELEKYGIYEFEPDSQSDSELMPYSDNSDVTVNTPSIVYDSIPKHWIVMCSGTWKNSNWMDSLKVGNVGGKDGFGVGYTHIGSEYKSSVISASASIRDKSGTISKSTSNRAGGDGSKGFGFELQDYVTSDGTKYVGYKWSGSCTYDLNFGNYSGIATGYYLHTWNSASIDSISFGVEGKLAGINVTFSKDSQSFSAYGGDKRFGTAN